MLRAVRAVAPIRDVYESDSCNARRAREEIESLESIYVPNGSQCPECPERTSPLANVNKQHGCKLTTSSCSCNGNWTMRRLVAVDSRPNGEVRWNANLKVQWPTLIPWPIVSALLATRTIAPATRYGPPWRTYGARVAVPACRTKQFKRSRISMSSGMTPMKHGRASKHGRCIRWCGL
jgi:hypothetical protein